MSPCGAGLWLFLQQSPATHLGTRRAGPVSQLRKLGLNEARGLPESPPLACAAVSPSPSLLWLRPRTPGLLPQPSLPCPAAPDPHPGLDEAPRSGRAGGECRFLSPLGAESRCSGVREQRRQLAFI